MFCSTINICSGYTTLLFISKGGKFIDLDDSSDILIFISAPGLLNPTKITTQRIDKYEIVKNGRQVDFESCIVHNREINVTIFTFLNMILSLLSRLIFVILKLSICNINKEENNIHNKTIISMRMRIWWT